MTESRVLRNLERWQTLIGSMLALLAALIGALLLRRQIKQAEDHENARITRRDIAARSALPVFLEQISEFCVELAHRLGKLYQPTHIAIPRDLLRSFQPRTMSQEALSSLQSTMENINEKSAVDQIRRVI
ncbi:hypothetical protein [Falsiroseomonas sp.]|uniref:hypothetical protein n=1 Tax=Falsiroseomonas sp. TaxID=2870721 RepID=UPI00271B5054|nr:hypothetical protein [Falsiroseomonas sp.]MDO9499345.1 hypothetical protein [Falsiroseomonas sp.]